MKRLSDSDANRLAKLAKEGDRPARNTLIESYIELADGIAVKYFSREDRDYDELKASAREYMILAIDEWKGRGQVKSHIIDRIKWGMIDHLRRLSPLTMYDHRAIKEIQKAEEELRPALGREPTLDELYQATKHRPETIINLRRVHGVARFHPVELDPDSIADSDDEYEKAIGVQDLQAALGILTDPERRVIQLKYGLKCKEHTVAQVARSMGIGTTLVMTHQRKALDKLRKNLDVQQTDEG